MKKIHLAAALDNFDDRHLGEIETGDIGAKQEFKDECDINVILKKFGIGYEMPANFIPPTSGDFTGITDFHQAMNQLLFNQQQFDSLPADMRARFDNDAGKFFTFATDEKNLEQMAELGMLNKQGLDKVERLKAERNERNDSEAHARVEARKTAHQGKAPDPNKLAKS